MNGLRNDEVVIINGRPHPLVGGRLRLAHENNEKLTVRTEIIHFVLGVEVVVRCELTTMKGTFSAVAVATATRDAALVDALLEVAETRSLARALRWAGYSTDVGAEELGAIDETHLPRRGPVPLRRDDPPTARSGPPASSAQLRCIRTLARRLGQEVDDAVAAVMPGMTLMRLTLPDASRIIDTLKVSAGEGQHAEGRRGP